MNRSTRARGAPFSRMLPIRTSIIMGSMAMGPARRGLMDRISFRWISRSLWDFREGTRGIKEGKKVRKGF